MKAVELDFAQPTSTHTKDGIAEVELLQMRTGKMSLIMLFLTMRQLTKWRRRKRM